MAIDGRSAGLLGIGDPVKVSGADAIRLLHQEGARVVMVTGDSRTTAEAVARKIGIDEIHADVLPEGKAQVVKRLQREGRVVAMAGDGINDAPALAAADVGIAMGTGTDVAMESAGVTLVKGDLRGIVRARRLSATDDEEHQAEPVLRVHLQRPRRADRRRDPVSVLWAPLESDGGGRGDELQLGLGDRQCAPAPAREDLEWLGSSLEAVLA